MATRIPISWLVVLAVLSLFAFFAYHILQVRSVAADSVTESFPRKTMMEAASATADIRETPDYLTDLPDAMVADDGAAPVVPNMRPVPHRMPHVPGQSEESLRESEPLQATPPSVQYDTPEATDPIHSRNHMNAEFGSNLRHPEQMIEMRPRSGMDGAVLSGLGSAHTSFDGNYATGYEPEMIQNGGEFMAGVSAFDIGGDGGAMYAAI